MTDEKSLELSQMQQALQVYFEFDQADLSANRLGEFSDRQKKAIKSDRASGDRAWVLVGVISMVVGLILLSFIFAPFLSNGGADWVDVLMNLPVILLGFSSLGVGVYSFFSWLRDKANPETHRVCKVEGPVNLVQAGYVAYRYPRRRVPVYELHVARKEFEVHPDLPKAMNQGDVYWVYYDSAGDAILSVEWVSKG